MSTNSNESWKILYNIGLSTICFSHLCPATNPAKVRSRKQPADVFKTNPEGKLVIREETKGEGKGEGLERDQGQEVEEEEMDVDEVIPLVPVN